MHCMGKKLRSTLWAFTASVLAASGTANAGITAFTTSGSPTGSGPYLYSYGISISTGDLLTSGSVFRIYDFGGYIAINTIAGAWAPTIAMTDAVSPLNVSLSHSDDPTLPNITFTYTGLERV